MPPPLPGGISADQWSSFECDRRGTPEEENEANEANDESENEESAGDSVAVLTGERLFPAE